MTGRSAVYGAIPAAVLGLLLLVVMLLGAGGSASPGAGGMPGGLAAGTALNGAAVPNQAWVPWIIKAGSLCPTFPPPVIAAQLESESGWDPTSVSPKGAQGLAQFEPGTWPGYSNDDAGDGNVSPFNPIDAIMAQGRFDCSLAASLGQVAQTSGQTVLTLALDAYNAGPGAVLAAGGIPAIGETQAYAPRIEALAARYAAGPVLAADTSGGSAFGQAMVAAAAAQIGKPYVWGGGDTLGPSGSAAAPPGQAGFDCSGLVLYAAFQASGGSLQVPHGSDTQSRIGQGVAAGPGQQVLASGLLQPGDVIGFQLGGPGFYDHIGIYAGNGTMLVAAHTGTLLAAENINTPYWLSTTWSARRYG